MSTSHTNHISTAYPKTWGDLKLDTNKERSELRSRLPSIQGEDGRLIKKILSGNPLVRRCQAQSPSINHSFAEGPHASPNRRRDHEP